MPNNQNEITFIVCADEFIFAACELEKSNNPDKVATASYYLYGHALELTYKGFLYKEGATIKELKSYRHNLEKVLNKTRDKGLCKYICIDEKYLDVVINLNKYYSTKELEYMSDTEKRLPLLWDVKDVAKKTNDALFSVLTEHL
jgi:hypothetical protein